MINMIKTNKNANIATAKNWKKKIKANSTLYKINTINKIAINNHIYNHQISQFNQFNHKNHVSILILFPLNKISLSSKKFNKLKNKFHISNPIKYQLFFKYFSLSIFLQNSKKSKIKNFKAKFYNSHNLFIKFKVSNRSLRN